MALTFSPDECQSKSFEKMNTLLIDLQDLLFADDLVLLSSIESGLQSALNNFAAACDNYMPQRCMC